MVTKYNWVFDRQIKEMIGADDPDYTGEDARVKLINNSTTNTLENLMGRSLSKNTYTEYFDTKTNVTGFYDVYGFSQSGYIGRYKTIRYYLKNYPVDVSAGFTVTYDPDELIDGDTPLTNVDYTLDAENGILIIVKPVGTFPRALKVVYTAGYVSSVDTDGNVVYDVAANPPQEQSVSYAIPQDLVQAALYQAMHSYEKSKFSNINVREARSQGGANATRYVNFYAIAPEAMAIIVQHKRRFIRSV